MSDLDLSFKKSQFQLSVFYKNINKPNREICDVFEEELKKSPQKIFDKMKNYGPGGEKIEQAISAIKDNIETEATKKDKKDPRHEDL